MTNMEILYSFAQYIKANNPTSIQVGYEKKNLDDFSLISESDEYINITEGNGQNIIDRVGYDYVLRDFEAVVMLKYNKVGIFDYREVSFQKFIEGQNTSRNRSFQFYELNEITTGFELSNKKLCIDYTKIQSPIILYNDEDTKTMFWIVQITHTN